MQKPHLSHVAVILLVSLFILITGNFTFFEKVLEVYPLHDHPGFLLSVLVSLLSVMVIVQGILSLFLPVRLVAVFMLMIAAVAGHFMDSTGVAIDTDMIQNIVETDTAEAADLVTTALIMRVLFLGILPSVLIWSLAARDAGWMKKMMRSFGLVVLGLVAVGGSALLHSDNFASFLRAHKPLRFYTNPTYPLYSAGKFAALTLAPDRANKFVTVTDHAEIHEEDDVKELVIVVVGETARADHFSLNGYSRDTNPLLEREQRLISYKKISSCGTSTSVSVACMFAFSGRDKFEKSNAKYVENTLDVLNKAGVSVLWRDNNSTSKGVANRLRFEDFKDPGKNKRCDTECRDEGMLDGLQEYVDQQEGDIIIILHQMGSHGPAYYRRYPAAFEKFQPTCKTSEISDCSQRELINSYDNTILYTDYFLSKVVSFLKTNSDKYETAMFYVSDHGESLGENGVYLHGMPYIMAPEAQTHVPLVAWIGENSDIDFEGSLNLKDQENSHDAISLTLLKIFEIDTDLYDAYGPSTALVKMLPED